MIDIEQLRRLAQAATQHVGRACEYRECHWLREGPVDFENADLFIASERPAEDAAFYAAANPAAISELLDRLEEAEKAVNEAYQRGYETGQEEIETELTELRSSMKFRTSLIGRTEAERDALRAKIEAMEKQEPAAWAATDETCRIVEALSFNQSRRFDTPLYALPDAQGEEK